MEPRVSGACRSGRPRLRGCRQPHQSIHVNGPTNWYSRWAAQHHLYHHFARPNRNHGVTTPIWDIILRTYERAPRVRIGRRHLANIPWMAAGLETGPAPPAFMADYELV